MPNLLSLHGLTSDQQHDIIRLLNLAGCFDSPAFENTLRETGHSDAEIRYLTKTICPAIESEKDLRLFKPDSILQALFPTLEKGVWPEATHNWLVKVTHQHFYVRKLPNWHYGERPYYKTGKWIFNYDVGYQMDRADESRLGKVINSLGVKNEKSPEKKEYDAIIILGTLYPGMKKKLEYVRNLIDQRGIKTQRIYLVSGERFSEHGEADTNVERAITIDQNINYDKITEKHLLLHAYKETKGEGDFAKLPLTEIHLLQKKKSLRKNDNAPRTTDKLTKFVEEIKLPADSKPNFLFISCAPYILEDMHKIAFLFEDKLPQATVEVAGCAINQTSPEKAIYSLATAIDYAYPRIAKQLGSKSIAESQDTLKTLRKGSPPKAAESKNTEVKPVQAVSESKGAEVKPVQQIISDKIVTKPDITKVTQAKGFSTFSLFGVGVGAVVLTAGVIKLFKKS